MYSSAQQQKSEVGRSPGAGPVRAKSSCLPLMKVLRALIYEGKGLRSSVMRGGTDFVRAEMYSSAQQQKSEVGRLKSAERIVDYETL